MKNESKIPYKFEPMENHQNAPEDNWPKLPVVLTGYKGSGKTVISEFLKKNKGYASINFADTLKRMLLEFGLTPDQVYGRSKETPAPILGGKTPRWAMQSLGAQWGRDCIGEDVWVLAWQGAVGQHSDEYQGPAETFSCFHWIVTDDCRFPNEVEAVRQSLPGAVIIRIIRPGFHPVDHLKGFKGWFFKKFPGFYNPHESERHIPHLKVDYEVVNDEGISALLENVRMCLVGAEKRRKGC